MVALAPNTSETSTWDVLDGFPKLHSRAREAKTASCTKAPASKSLVRVEIWLVIYDRCDGLESFTRDPIGYKSGSKSVYGYIAARSLTQLDPSGLFALDDTKKNPPYNTDPGHTNCAGFSLHPDKVAVAPTGSLFDIIAAFGFGNCSSSTASACLENCKTKETKDCVQVYVNLREGVIYDMRAALERLVPDFGTDPRVTDVSSMLLYHWTEVLQKLAATGAHTPQGNPLLDFYFLKCNGPEFAYQKCHAVFGSDGSGNTPTTKCKDRRNDPKIWTPSEGDPEYFDEPKIHMKVCCCKDGSKPEVESAGPTR